MKTNCPHCRHVAEFDLDMAYVQKSSVLRHLIEECDGCGEAFVHEVVVAITHRVRKLEPPP